MMPQPQLLLVGGPNGSGKSTIYKVLREVDQSDWLLAQVIIPDGNYINPDTIAKEKKLGDLAAGKIALNTVRASAENNKSFAYETTLSGRSNTHRIVRLRDQGYRVISLFLWVRSAELSMARVTHRASRGEHYIPMEHVLRRHVKTVRNFIDDIIPNSDMWFVLDNSSSKPEFIAWGGPEFRGDANKFMTDRPDPLRRFLKFYETGEDPCLKNPFNCRHENPRKLDIGGGDWLTHRVLTNIETGLRRELENRPKGMTLACLDQDNRMCFGDT